MDLNYSGEEAAFRDEVRTWLVANLPADLQSKVTQYQHLSKDDLVRWQAAGNHVAGLQIDFDAATRGLGSYAAFLAQLRRRLPGHYRLSVTGLMDWSAHGDPAVSGSVCLGDLQRRRNQAQRHQVLHPHVVAARRAHRHASVGRFHRVPVEHRAAVARARAGVDP